ncbi:N-formylglutamate amidohydrolase [Croceicoccus bisphenolivorans]|uniref:N-formylglutamate amidohydrolase n=1 Tax=Croceicoccus bisphenolivorans TaxID=1783232 RepID=UPI0009EEE082|nr:N-formylglutamate amidohydrolase [Croceicoccus bisphenolivorans]
MNDRRSDQSLDATRGSNGTRAAGLVSGGSIPGLSRPAFTLQRPAALQIPVLIAVPHAGRAYPPELLARMRFPDATPLRLEDRFVDEVARQAATRCGAALLVAHAPRAMIDLNRDPLDLDLGMFTAGEDEKKAMRLKMPQGGTQSARSMRGLGLFPRRISGMGELWRAPMQPIEASRRIAAVHSPYHDALAGELGDICAAWGGALLLDLHSMPDLPARSGGLAPATHVLGDRFGASCARPIVDAGLGTLHFAGAEAAYNRPYAGGYVLDRHGVPRRGINAVQLELARSLYLDDRLDRPGDGVEAQARIVADAAIAMAEALTGSESDWAQAAE